MKPYSQFFLCSQLVFQVQNMWCLSDIQDISPAKPSRSLAASCAMRFWCSLGPLLVSSTLMGRHLTPRTFKNSFEAFSSVMSSYLNTGLKWSEPVSLRLGGNSLFQADSHGRDSRFCSEREKRSIVEGSLPHKSNVYGDMAKTVSLFRDGKRLSA